MSPLPLVRVLYMPWNPMRPREGAVNTIFMRPAAVSLGTISRSSPLRRVSRSITAPVYCSSSSSTISSTGSSFSPLGPSLITTSGGETESSKPARRMFSISTPSWTSPRPCTSYASLPMWCTRRETLVSASALRYSPILDPVSWVPSLPPRAELLTENFMAIVGGSMGVEGRRSCRPTPPTVSVTLADSSPASVMTSPAVASSISMRSMPTRLISLVTRPSSTEPPSRRVEILSPTRTVPSATRPVTTRPRKVSRSIMLTSIANGFSESPLGQGTLSQIASRSGFMVRPSWLVLSGYSSVAHPSRALA
mmetsp:Transcript_61498/g.194662  ORF Transcript_61498/g.194662 Transcript_61498/m.194662 type:complete len:308 (-) Transcript_61498:576-1499(-)